MSTVGGKLLADCATANEALAEMAAGFAGADELGHRYATVEAGNVPEPFHSLLVHTMHMTAVLENHYHDPLSLYVMESHRHEGIYRRKILLAKSNRIHTELEYGLVRINLAYMPRPVRAELMLERTPLGAILIRHAVMRRVEPRWYLRFDAEDAMPRWFGTRMHKPMYGRLGTIYCNGEPAIEVLEIVTGISPASC